MTGEEWDARWFRIREQALTEGALPTEAEAIADVDTVEQFGPRPTEET